MWSVNIEGFTAEKHGELTHLMKEEKPHIVMLQETWLKSSRYSDADVTIPGYSMFRKDRLSGEHGGILTYYSHNLAVTLVESSTSSKEHEVLWISIRCGKYKIYVANVYRSPSNDDSVFDVLAIDTEMFQTSAPNSKILVFGDLNCHHATWLGSKDMNSNPKTNDAGLACYAMCQTMGLINVIAGNTFLRNRGSAVFTLDLALTDSLHSVSKVVLENSVGSSSHARIAVTLRFSPTLFKTYTKVSWQYHLANWVDMCQLH